MSDYGFAELKSEPYSTLMERPKAIIFDLDGTLIHSAPDLHAAINAMLSSLGRHKLDLFTVISFIGNGVEKLVERSLNATGGYKPPLKRTALDFFLTFYSQNITTLTRPYSGVRSALQTFHDAGIPLGICTNKPTEAAQEICDKLKLSRFFKVISGAESGKPKKPDPTPLLDCIKDLGVLPPQALYVGDSEIDYITARNGAVPFKLFSKGYLNVPMTDLTEVDYFDNWTDHGVLKN